MFLGLQDPDPSLFERMLILPSSSNNTDVNVPSNINILKALTKRAGFRPEQDVTK
jgi:hypothetical protein